MTRSAVSFVGVDLGTSAVKAAVFTLDGTHVARRTVDVTVHTPHRGWAESDPLAWQRAAEHAVALVVQEARERHRGASLQIAGLAIAGQMHGVVGCLSDGTPCRPAILWADERTEDLREAFDAAPEAVRRRLANPFATGMAGPTISWVTRHEPHVAARVRWWLQPKDWLRVRWTGVATTEPSDASGTLLYDVQRDTFDDDAIALWDVPAGTLPPVVPSASVAGWLAHDVAARTGLPSGLPIAAGAADTAAAALALLAPGTPAAMVTVGTGAQVVARSTTCHDASRHGVHTYRLAEPSGFYRLAAVRNAGSALAWARRQARASHEELHAAVAQALSAEDGAGRVQPSFSPFLVHERWDLPGLPRDGAMPPVGWSGGAPGRDRGGPSRAQHLFAAWQAVGVLIAHAADLLEATAPTSAQGKERAATPCAWTLAGGGARHPAVQRLLAGLLQRPLQIAGDEHATVRGAAMLAAAAAGVTWRTADAAGGDGPHVRRVTVTPGITALEARRIRDAVLDAWRTSATAADPHARIEP